MQPPEQASLLGADFGRQTDNGNAQTRSPDFSRCGAPIHQSKHSRLEKRFPALTAHFRLDVLKQVQAPSPPMDVFDRFSFHRGFTKRTGLHDRFPFRLRQFVHNFGSGR